MREFKGYYVLATAELIISVLFLAFHFIVNANKTDWELILFWGFLLGGMITYGLGMAYLLMLCASGKELPEEYPEGDPYKKVG
ncbi:hypothetical protein BpJC7_22570 [Weizmannia acidilactici]|uniref:Uncharacterized protein n=1 Tax=Weizmannia acidilactici TaxID=2607726 RepID=A0A5J4JPJ5_9BACI|nr:hypothetical protein [Weizmannia acidilactici]GER68111.1 hypothetical protein BpJC4_25820 [Weizmannia acidilactici]GER70954.1 hypothetical protein BpJC7_22570 [Weizmannia acidilactici]GER73931.1 hypothetical protein BpPP18_19980 [Weizmannia acidilactici]